MEQYRKWMQNGLEGLIAVKCHQYGVRRDGAFITISLSKQFDVQNTFRRLL